MTVTTIGLVVALPVACWLATSVTRVPDGRRVVVIRDGVVRRVHETGFVFRLPLLERFVSCETTPKELPLLVRATTSDGTRIVLMGEVTVALPVPLPGAVYADPWVAAEIAAREAVARVVATWPAAEVTRIAGSALRRLRHAVSAAVDEHGVTLLELDVMEVQVPLFDPDART